ncbi:hypothetical protein EfmAA610_08890 [Enterococcus faecium]|nr:hypothetical protein EfmAA610_08890 [Enterococcus faecium]
MYEKDGEIIIAHVKNTGRGKEVLIPGAEVAIVFAPGPKRKTAYDLIAVKRRVTGLISIVNCLIGWQLMVF